MGGGALKVEAAHLRLLPIPVFSSTELKSLEKLGSTLSKTRRGATDRKVLDEIDVLFASHIAAKTGSETESVQVALKTFLKRRKETRRR